MRKRWFSKIVITEQRAPYSRFRIEEIEPRRERTSRTRGSRMGTSDPMISAPTARGEEFFDPASKYHVASVVPYTRYFLAAILQFQFHRALAKEAGCTLPLNRCSIYESAAAGKKLTAMLSMGVSRPWQDALEAMTGSREMDATAIVDYFAPLKKYMDDELAKKGVKAGW